MKLLGCVPKGITCQIVDKHVTYVYLLGPGVMSPNIYMIPRDTRYYV